MSMNPNERQFNHIIAYKVSKHELVVHTLPADHQHMIANTPVQVRRLLRAEHRTNARLGIGPLLVVCEATGGYEHHVLAEAAALGLAIHRAHGSRTRLFARFNGKMAKTDAIDARLIARYGLTPGGNLDRFPRHDAWVTCPRTGLPVPGRRRTATLRRPCRP